MSLAYATCVDKGSRVASLSQTQVFPIQFIEGPSMGCSVDDSL